MTSAYYRGSVGAVIAFDVTKVSTSIYLSRKGPVLKPVRISDNIGPGLNRVTALSRHHKRDSLLTHLLLICQFYLADQNCRFLQFRITDNF